MWGLSHTPKCAVNKLVLKPKLVTIGDALEFSFNLSVEEEEPVKLRIEYAIDYLKANNKHSRKLFRITEHIYKANQVCQFRRKQSFRDLTTRKHYPGSHTLSIIINGIEMASAGFTVVTDKAKKA
ncbi:hypothetical protein EXU57_15660 [Segetibacter sp. 3557_3]|uniref:hypothetical protein n=1 Tax=Segetibacter sp. 3557_3 TaxID=2547429 RepID=UPI001058A4E4|nr:hypothetical protein [Segetibacter sp. 3557_3]TDH24247.1 hypothetical protein EXU57_15660 [Segetibacter sp. 3557_3]